MVALQHEGGVQSSLDTSMAALEESPHRTFVYADLVSLSVSGQQVRWGTSGGWVAGVHPRNVVCCFSCTNTLPPKNSWQPLPMPAWKPH